ncbi:MAG TPA: hypothetical protein VF581_03105 [Flavobacterium sp.]|jgi:hypothetical protein
MEKNTITTLAVKFWGMIETPPLNNREQFRQGVIDTILKVLKMQDDVTIEYIGYRPDRIGIHHLTSSRTIYEDCVFVSLNMHSSTLYTFDEKLPETIVNNFINVFENKTNHHLEIDSAVVNKHKQQRTIEMTSDWKFYLKHA